MSKRKKGKTKRRVRRFVAGPLTVEQIGADIFYRTDWDPDDFERHRQRLKQLRPELRNEIDEKVRQIETIIRAYDPFSLLQIISIENCLGSTDIGPQDTPNTNICYAEYVQSLILAQNELTFGHEPSDETIEHFQKIIKDLFNDVWMYFAFEMAEDDSDRDKIYLRFLTILQYLFVRGDSIPQHHNDLMMHLFSPHDTFFKAHYGFSASEVISAVAEIERQLEEDFNRNIELLFTKLKELTASCNSETQKRSDEIQRSILAVAAEGARPEHFLKDLQATIIEQPFLIEPNELLPTALLEQLSASFGDNRDFSTFHKAPGWPMNDSVVHSRPLIQHNGRYYCFIPQLLFHNIGRILEQWIQGKDRVRFETVYQERRGQYLENKSLEYLGKILPGARIFAKLYYGVEEDGQHKRVETDGLILYDNNVMVIEAKAGSLHVAARRGGLKKLERDCREILEGAYRQARRTLNYIRQTDQPRFEDINGNEVLVLENKEDFTDFWMINVSGENLGHLAAHLNSLRSLNLMQVSEWPWSVFVNDLRVISELIEFPSEFFHYLHKRIRLNEFPQFSSSDELDIFMFYLKKGLYFDEKKVNNLDMFFATGFTHDLDSYYNYLSGTGPEASKPRLDISERFKALVTAIEGTGKTNRTRLVNTLLNFHKEGQDEVVEKLVEFAARSREKAEFDDFSVRNRQANAAMTFFFYPRFDARKLENMRHHSQILKYHHKLDEYALFTVDTSKSGWTGLDFEIFRYKWAHDPDMAENVKRLRTWRVQRHRQTRGQIGRNEPCPCGSGKKYKKCCGHAMLNGRAAS